MLKYIVLSGILTIALGHIWCGHLALQKHGYWRWAVWDIWGMERSLLEQAAEPEEQAPPRP